MKARAEATVYWPGMNASIRNKRFLCRDCNGIAPSQPKEPIQLSPAPEWPFQQICADYFELSGHSYLSIVDRYSGWINIYHIPTNHATSKTLISICRALFIDYGGPQFKSKAFSDFLTTWGVHYRKSSVEYPQSNGRAELGVKAAKRVILDNSSPNGSLDTDKAACTIMQYRNTPLPYINLSPSQILFRRQLRDYLPAHPQHYKLHKEWLISAAQREQVLAERNNSIATRYNLTAHNLLPLLPGTHVSIQDGNMKRYKWWNKTGTVVESLPNRQYHVKLDGSGRVTLRNRRFLKPTPLQTASHVVYPFSASNDTVDPTTHPIVDIVPYYGNEMNQSPMVPQILAPPPIIRKIPHAMKCLSNYNTPGLNEQLSSRRSGRDTNT